MVALNPNSLTLADWAKRRDPDGTVPVIAELLSQTNEILKDAAFVEGNQATGHTVVIQTGLPTVYWRQLNQGIAPSKGTTAQVTEAIGMLEARSEVDMDLASLNNDERAFRLSEARMFLEAMNQQVADTYFYGDTGVNPERFLGFLPRYNDIAGAPGNEQNIIDNGGTTDTLNTSIWLVVWGPETVFSIFPKGSTAGLSHEDLGRQTVVQQSATFAAGSGEPILRLEALVDLFKFKLGLVVKDWRYVVRIANIDTTDLGNLANEQLPTSFTHLIHRMIQAVGRVPNLSMGRAVWYTNRTVFTGLMRLGLEKSQNAVTVQPAIDQFGTVQNMLSVMGIQVRRVDALRNDEDRVT